MHKNLIMSWPQIVVLLLIAGSILVNPTPGPWPSIAGGLLILLVVLGIFYKVRSERRVGSEPDGDASSPKGDHGKPQT